MNKKIELQRGKLTTREITMSGLCVALLAICSWITIPMAVPFTLQTFAVFFVLRLMGGRLGTYIITAYILLGAVGLPVFSGFKGGPAALFGTTGGYILGFLITGIVYWIITKIWGSGRVAASIALVLGLALCYAFGTVWFMTVYASANGPISIAMALGWCVIPFVIPDLIKMVLAFELAQVVGRAIKRNS